MKSANRIRSVSAFLLMIATSQALPLKAEYLWDTLPMNHAGAVRGLVPNPNRQGEMWYCPDIGRAARFRESEGRARQLGGHFSNYYDNIRNAGMCGAVDPSQANVIYWVFGSKNWSSEGCRLMKSTDSGENCREIWSGYWTPARDTYDTTCKLKVDPNNGNYVYLCGQQGLYRSTNGGDAWTLSPGSSPTGVTTNYDAGSETGIKWVAIDPGETIGTGATLRSKNIYIGVMGVGFYKSVDGGSSWSMVNTTVGARAVCSANGTVFMADGTMLHRYTRAGTWTGSIQTTVDANAAFSSVAVDIKKTGANSNLVVVSHKRSQGWDQDTLRRSVDGGNTWTTIQLSGTVNWQAPSADGTTGKVMSVAIDPFNSNHLWYGTWWSVFRIKDPTVATPALENMGNGMEIAATSGGQCSPEVQTGKATLFLGGGDHASVFAEEQTLEYGYTPQFYLSPVVRDRDSVYSSFCASGIDVRNVDGKYLFWVGRGGGQSGPGMAAYSTDGGDTLVNISANLPKNSSNVAFGAGDVAVSAGLINGKTHVIWAPQGTTPRWTDDNGTTWGNVTGLPQLCTETSAYLERNSLLVSDRVNASFFYAYWDGKVYRSSDGGKNFSIAHTFSTYEPFNGSRWTIKPNIRAAPQAGLFAIGIATETRSTDKEGLWLCSNGTAGTVTISKLNNVQSVRGHDFGKKSSRTGNPVLFVSGIVNNKVGIFRSEDLGSSWETIAERAQGNLWDHTGIVDQDGAGSTIVACQKVEGRLFVWTNGVGCWVGTDSGRRFVKNSGFETASLQDWTQWSSLGGVGSATRATPYSVREGVACLSHSNTAAAWNVNSSQAVSNVPPGTYSILVDCKSGGFGSISSLLQVRFPQNTSRAWITKTLPLSSNWTTVELPNVVISPDDSGQLQINLFTSVENGSSTPTVLFDNIRIISMEDNIKNSDFEEAGLASWSQWSSTGHASAAVRNAGGGSLYGAHDLAHWINPTTSTSWDVDTKQNVNNLPLGRYKLQLWYQRGGAGFTASQVQVRFPGNSSKGWVVKNLPANAGNWRMLELNGINLATGDGSSIEIHLYTKVVNGTGAPIVKFDSLRLIPVD
jgi:hypothetical protein